MKVLQRLDEALGELLLVRYGFRVEELGDGGRRGHHAVGLDDEPLQLRRRQLEEPQVRGAEDALGVAEMWFEVCVIRQSQVIILLHHYFRGQNQHWDCSQGHPVHYPAEAKGVNVWLGWPVVKSFDRVPCLQDVNSAVELRLELF